MRSKSESQVEWNASEQGFDEIWLKPGKPRKHYEQLLKSFGNMSPEEVTRRENLQYLSLLNQGITFNVYGEAEGRERVFPFDFVPRIITAANAHGAPTCCRGSTSPQHLPVCVMFCLNRRK